MKEMRSSTTSAATTNNNTPKSKSKNNLRLFRGISKRNTTNSSSSNNDTTVTATAAGAATTTVAAAAPPKIAPKLKFQAAGLAIGAAAKREKDKQEQPQQAEVEASSASASSIIMAAPAIPVSTTTTAAVAALGSATLAAAAAPISPTEIEPTKTFLVSPKSKFQAAAFAVASAKATEKQQQHQEQNIAKEKKTATFSASTKGSEGSFSDKDTVMVSPKSKFQAAAFAVQHSRVSDNGDGDGDGNGDGDDHDDDGEDEETKKETELQWAKLAYASKLAAMAAKNQRAQQNEQLYQRMVVSADTWDVWSPPPSNSVSGVLIPRMINKHSTRRKVSLEIHRVIPIIVHEDSTPTTTTTTTSSNTCNDVYHEAVLRILVPETQELARQRKIEGLHNMHHKEGSASSSKSTRQIMEHIPDTIDEEDEEDATSMTTKSSTVWSPHAASKYDQLTDHGGKEYTGWKPKYSLPVHGIYMKGHRKKSVHFLISFNGFKQSREFIFDTIDDRRLFLTSVETQKKLEDTRQKERLQTALDHAKIVLPKFETITLLIEIVSGYDIPIGDYTSSDPYVVVLMGHQEIHRTKVLPKTLNPIWTLKTGSLFLLTVESKHFFVENGLQFVLKDYDQFGKHDVLGVVKVEPKLFYNANGTERMEFKLQPPHGSQEKDVPGMLVLRCRRATVEDQKFMSDYETAKQSQHAILPILPTHGAKSGARYEAPEATTNVIRTLITTVKKKDKETGETYVRFVVVVVVSS